MSSSAHVVDVDTRNFEQVVLRDSVKTPVLVDFWATWCEPCKALGPVLERIAESMGGAILLAKVDIDASPEVAQAFRIQSVPTVVLITNGQPVDAFSGTKSEAEVREFLERNNLRAGTQSPLAEAKELEAAGELAQAVGLLSGWLDSNPEDAPARIALTRVLITADDVENAREVFSKLTEEERESPEAQSVAVRFDLLENAGDIDALRAELKSDPQNVGKRVELGRALVAVGEIESGLEELLEAAIHDLHYEDDAPRRAMIEVFQALGPQDPMTLEYQQRLSVLLCS